MNKADIEPGKRVVHVVDDNDEFRETACFWLEGLGYTVRAWGDALEAIEALALRPRDEQACLLLDVRMPRMSGLDLHDALLERGIAIPVVYMSGHADVPLAVQAMQKGAVTFLEKPFDDGALADALTRAFAAAAAPPPDVPRDPAQLEYQRREESLAPRELEVLTMVTHGFLNKVIADRIGLSVKTVELYRARGLAKMQAKSAAELTRMMVSRRS